jgi:two-component system, OmpR family, sensor histidine kinase RstB
MRSFFIRIYLGILLAMVAIILVVTIATYYLNKYRITEHVYQNYSGTFQLIGQGVARHQGQQQQQWLSAIEKLSDLKFKQYNFSEGSLTKNKLATLINNKFIFNINNQLTAGEVFILLPKMNAYLTTKLSDFGSSLVRISAFLILNELGRHKNEQRVATLDKLRAMFNYPIQLKTLTSLHLPANNIRTVKKGNIAVVLKNSTTSYPALMAYAPLGNSPYALVLGSIPFFDWFPLPLIYIQIVFILILIAISVYLLVRPLEKRLATVDQQIEQIGHDKSLSMTTPSSTDAIGKLANTVNSMSARIHGLMNAQDDMIRAISHELRTPVTRIRFRLAMLEKQQVDNSNQQILGIERDLNELENLIDEVLTFSKLKQKAPILNIKSFKLNDFITELTNSANVINSTIDIKMSINTEQYINADRRYLFRALENLLVNALKYASTHIEIGFQQIDDQQQVWVADDGEGIPEEERANIFEPFKRIDASRNRRTGGYGLGLAIVKQIAKWHCGKVTIASSYKGGAKMIFSWPQTLNDKINETKNVETNTVNN